MRRPARTGLLSTLALAWSLALGLPAAESGVRVVRERGVGDTIVVETVGELLDAVDTAGPGTTILVADGTYELDGAWLRLDTPGVMLRSLSGDREAVVLDGNYLTTEIVQIAAPDVVVARLTLREAYDHAVHVVSTAGSDTTGTVLFDLHVVDAGQQAIKINPDGEDTWTDDGLIAGCHIELTDAGRARVRDNCYTGGIDAHSARGWTVRDNRVEGFWCETGLSEHAIHFWRGSRDTRVLRNEIVDNARGIGFGLEQSGSGRSYPDDPCPGAGGGYVDHYDGTVVNNTVFAGRAELFDSQFGFDCGICLWQACGARVLHNTVASTEAPFSSIEWRFENTEVGLAYNLATHNLRDRGGLARLLGNLDSQPLSLFVDGPGGDLHLAPGAGAAIDQAIPLPGVTGDVDGDPRPQGAASDIGADEAVAGRR